MGLLCGNAYLIEGVTTMLVYRIEKDGSGAWQSGVVHQADCWAGTKFSPGHGPSPFNDQEKGTALYHLFNTDGSDHYKYYFGFQSIDAYQRWFHCARFRKGLAECGAKLVVYDVDNKHVATGNWQVAFRLKQARKVAELCPYRCLRARKGYFTITMSAALQAVGKMFNPATQQVAA